MIAHLQKISPRHKYFIAVSSACHLRDQDYLCRYVPLCIPLQRQKEIPMSHPRTHLFLQRAVERELHFCLRVNQSLSRPAIQEFFSVISRLGDGIFWYGLIILLPIIYGLEALRISFLMIVAGVINLLVYKTVKQFTCRERPCASNSKIIPGARLLDHYSFPSGHALHTAGFTTLVLHYFPALGSGADSLCRNGCHVTRDTRPAIPHRRDCRYLDWHRHRQPQYLFLLMTTH